MFATLHAGIGVKQTHSYARSLVFIHSNLPYPNAFATINEIKPRPISIRPIALH